VTSRELTSAAGPDQASISPASTEVAEFDAGNVSAFDPQPNTGNGGSGDLITQLDEAGIKVAGANDIISDEAKMELLTHLRRAHGRVEDAAVGIGAAPAVVSIVGDRDIRWLDPQDLDADDRNVHGQDVRDMELVDDVSLPRDPNGRRGRRPSRRSTTSPSSRPREW